LARQGLERRPIELFEQLPAGRPEPYAEMAHYGTALLPTRAHRPRDKAKVEAAVLIVERWISARLRHRRFYSLAELNAAIGKLLHQLNEERPIRLGDWIGAHTRAFAAIAGVPRLIIPDNAKIAVIKACLYEPQVNRLGDTRPDTSRVFILGLDLKEIGLNGAGTTHAPQQRCKPEHQLALHGISAR
jgi:hypothetical protein